MQKTFMRIPYTGPLPPPQIIPRSANTPVGAIHALQNFLSTPPSGQRTSGKDAGSKAVLLTGAGVSVASGLADYRGTSGTYTLNKTYRPIYYSEFLANHEARKRYWARSFLGWTNLHRARPNDAHYAIRELGRLGLLSSVITQNVDSFHNHAHPELPTLELHGYLRSLVCVHCRTELPRDEFQKSLSNLNPAWADFLAEMLEVGALDTENPDERRKKGLKTNPDGDVDLPDAPYTTFRYPACPTCLASPPKLADGSKGKVEVDSDGAWTPESTAGVLKPAVIMFGESINPGVKEAVEKAIDEAGRILVVGSSLATYSAWRLVKRAHEQKMPIGVVNIGGVRGEANFFEGIDPNNNGELGMRCSEKAEKVLTGLITILRSGLGSPNTVDDSARPDKQAARERGQAIGRME
ncbi:hypothetical protein MMC10_003321 [Thelotrema lepadinum]|nr:hypothetical protein [Thelotrema lepadinum]